MKIQLIKWLFLLPLILQFGCGVEEKAPEETVLRPVKYGKVQPAGNVQKEVFSGTAQSSKSANLSFKISGNLRTLNVKIGDKVRKGQLIATVDKTDYNVQYQQSVANLKNVETQIKSANTQLVNAKATYERIEKLYENNSVSLSEYEQAKSAYETAQSSYTAAQAQANATEKQVEAAQNQVNYATLVAPFTGVVTMVNVEENELVASGTPIATISSIGEPEISVGIPEVFISKIKPQQNVQINFAALSNKQFSGKVYEVGYSSSGGSTYPVTVKINNPTDDIRPGMAAEVTFNFADEKHPTSSALSVPITAVGEDTAGHFVFILKKADNHYLAQKQTIEIGKLMETGFILKSGLGEGELVATAGLSSLLDGMKVKLLEQ